jgi:hypothetical protein
MPSISKVAFAGAAQLLKPISAARIRWSGQFSKRAREQREKIVKAHA